MALSKLTDIRKSLSVEVEDLQVNGITTFTGSVSIGGTLTYQDVTNVDSVGIITAQAGINVSGGTGTFAGDVLIADKIVHTGDTNTSLRFPAADTITAETGGSERLRITSAGLVSIPISGSLQVGAAGSGETDTKVYVANTGGNAYIQLKGADSSGTVGLKFGRNSVANRAGIDWSASTDALSFRTGGTGERLRIDSGGSVRVGNNSSFSAHAAADNLVVGDNSGSNGMTILTNESTGTIFFNDGSGNDGAIQYVHSSSPNYMRLASSGQIEFDAGGSERLRIDSSGKIGINNNSPTSQLDGANDLVIGDTSDADSGITLVTTTSGQGLIHFSDATSGNARYDGFIGYEQTSRALKFGTAQAERLRIDNNGRVLINTTSNTNAHTQSDDLIVGNTSHGHDTGITIVSNPSYSGWLAFSDGTSADDQRKASIVYQHSQDTLYFRNNGNQNRIIINSDGYVTKPHNAMFKAVRTTNQSISSAGWHVIQFNSDSATGCFDVGNNFDTSNHRFTAPVTGYYQFGLNQRVDGGDTSYFRVALTVNDGGLSGQYPYGHAIYRDIDGFSYYTFSITSLIYLTAGQYVKANAYSHTDTTWYLQDESQFYGYLVG